MLFWKYGLLFIFSILAGFINTLVGSGSLIMLPLLIFVGLSPQVANGTNRVAILVQSVVALHTYFQHSTLSLKGSYALIVSACGGALLGAWLATQISPKLFEYFLGFLMLAMFFVVLLKPEKWFKNAPNLFNKQNNITSWIVLFAVGIYGGFVQGGVGVFLMASLIMQVGYDLHKTNALKLLIISLYALPVLLIFAYYGQVNWGIGGITAIGQGIGAYLGAKFALTNVNIHLWTYRLLLIILLVSAFHFWFS
ncbi:MAG: sulfite exporter TauE/SafE family protein [Microscillaceae bacterium]|nr:sulfite exporter TauE/SafE family protein [Microscillaceae bacterium]MDW8460974.1 sulfite exporter TauE/SafE family protein [Cytophagales bacterium]